MKTTNHFYRTKQTNKQTNKLCINKTKQNKKATGNLKKNTVTDQMALNYP